ncbi:interferon-induced very large GTPase 1 [Salmo trutta]|uniref:interferon-induced very large GTPase 1 n=1 Tax=Salmo trutta TaxID=8032 RepID=UPI0011321907|nr:interferon-induced very large GTPase 1-like [Salmo trutta]
METGENKEMETKSEDALDPSSECTCQGEEHQLFLQLEPEALDITDIESQHSDQQDDKTTKTDEGKTDITTISSNFPQSSKIDIENESDDLVDPCDESLIPTCTIPSAHQDQDTMVHLDHFTDPHISINMDNVGTVSKKSLEPEAFDITDIKSQHSNQQDNKTTKTDEEKKEITTSSNFAQMTPVLTIALIGGTDSMEIESGNLLLGQDDLLAAELSQIAPRMYDLSGRCVSVINMLGLQSSELTQENHIGPLVHKQGEMYDEEIRKRQLKTDWGDRSQSEEKTASVPGNLPEDGVANKKKGEEKILEEIDRSLIEKNIPENIQLAKVEELMCRLHLQDKYQDKLTTADFLNIGSSAQHRHEPQTENKLAHTFLQRLLMLDYRARYIPVRDENSEMHDTNDNRNDNAETEESAFDALFNKNTVSGDIKRNTHVHPMDGQMAVFHCSDSFLRQFMVTKLSVCQYALPLLVPNPFTEEIECPLWTFRQIRKTWKSTNDSNMLTSQSMPIYKAETPMVSFFRLGSVSSSKSQLMSNLINQRHSTFFHRHCPGSSKTCLLMDGVVEIAWYCPAGKPNDIFTDCVAFCNLHGDAIAKEIQRDRLIEKASVNVILLPSLGKGDKSMAIVQELFKSSKPLICLLTEEDSVATEIKKGKYKMGLRDRNQSDVSEELKRIIRNNLSRPCCSFKLEDMAEYSGFRVDEDDEDCQIGKTNALQITDLLKEMELSKIKEKFIPCQGRLWHDWCQKNKDLYRLQGNLEMERSKLQHEMMQIRHHQHKVAFTELMQMFITSLRSL